LNIFKDVEFSKSRDVLLARKRQLVETHAKGNRPQACRALTEEEEELLFDKGLFGDDEPETLQRTVWWTLSLHFGFRARDESRKLKWGDVELGFDQESGKEILVWKAERGSKTRHGEGHQRAFYPTAQATNNRRFPVNLYKVFASHRPDTSKTPDSPFFLTVNHKRKADSQVWYSKDPLGKNSIGMFLMKAANAAGLSGKITNHSVRKTCISRLMDADVPTNFVAQLSGHKNLKSLDAYKTASVTHQRQMSRILSCSASDRPASSASSPLQTLEVRSVSHSQTRNSPWLNSTETVSKTTGLFSGAKIDGCTFNFNFGSDDCSNASKQTKKRRLAFLDDSDSD
jgi:integrase